jgi:hypothetical protein
MKQNLIIALCLFVLIGGSLFVRGRSSYAAFAGLGEPGSRSVTTADATENGAGNETGDDAATDADGVSDAEAEIVSVAEEEKSLEDIALDKRIAAQHAKNERTYRESGIAGSIPSGPSEISQPRFDINEYGNIIYNTLFVYMEEHPDTFHAPPTDESEYIQHRSFDPRISRLLYGETKGGIISGFANENLVAWDLKKLNGDYTILILARDAVGEKWRVLTEGDIYKLRKELTDGD